MITIYFLRGHQIPLHPPEAVKKFSEEEFGGSGDTRGRSKFTPPKQALIPPWPARYLNQENGNARRPYLKEFSAVASVAPRRSGKCFTAMHRPPGFDAVNLPLPRATKEAFASLRSIFPQLPFSKGGKIGMDSLFNSP
jgi:hypothetical protein